MQLYMYVLLVLLFMVEVLGRQSGPSDTNTRYGRRRSKHRRSVKPNIVIVLSDDQDLLLGSMDFMPKTQRILGAGGAVFDNTFVSTPMCCPSRSTFLTGLYVHNHNVYTNNDNCSSIQWQQTHETRNFGTYLSNAGYRTGYFGKYLNEYNGTYIPPGWSEWVGLIRNSRFYNYTLNFNGKKIRHGDNYYTDYLPDLITNDSITFLKQSKQYFPNRPVAMVLSMPGPHGPEDAAPQYQHLFENVTTHQTPSWNFAPNPDKQWLLQYTGKMADIHIKFTNMLHRKRLQTLQSIDDAIEKVYWELKHLDELDNTYFLFTSDHGYHLGQYGLLKGKAMPYDFDIRVPFYMRGPNVPRGVRVHDIVGNVDIAPTMLDIAGIPAPDHMDGKSILPLLENYELTHGGVVKRKKAWRDTFLIARGKITPKKLHGRDIIEAEKNNLYIMDPAAEKLSKGDRLGMQCSHKQFKPPCRLHQQFECKPDSGGKMRMFKCRTFDRDMQTRCNCTFDLGITKRERKVQRQFLKQHVNKPQSLKAKFIRYKRSLLREFSQKKKIKERQKKSTRGKLKN